MSEREHLGDIGMVGRVIVNWIFKNYDGRVDWINRAQNGDKCRAASNMAMDLPFPCNTPKFFTC
jgi:hypothetical protein